MSATSDIASRLEAAGFDDFHIDYERGIAIVFFKSFLVKETPCQTNEPSIRITEVSEDEGKVDA